MPLPAPVEPLSSAHQLPLLECRALLDTGADGTSVCVSAARAAGLQSLGKRPVSGISGLNYHRTWATRLGFFVDQAGAARYSSFESHFWRSTSQITTGSK
jgi:hypothetical protein